MKLSATVANSLWVASSFGKRRRFQHALHNPAIAQRRWLQRHLIQNARCSFFRKHKLDSVQSYEEFARQVPLCDYETLTPWVERIRHGESNVLTSARVTRLIPTSGSMAARKLIPFTTELQCDFDHAIAPWIFDLARQRPAILGGPAYWSISPSLPSKAESSAVPIGFADDASYLGGVKGWLVRAALVIPGETTNRLDAFQYATLLALLRERSLRLISVWHPSFLTLLLDALPAHWDALLAEIARNLPQRARELERANPLRPESLWPRLQVISCWGDGHAEFAFAELGRRFPRTRFQRKGLLATEAFVTIPFANKHPLAVCSHFFEFADATGHLRLAHELREGETYEVIVTTSGGLWRYRLGDLVRVNGFVEATPSFQFLGRSGNVSDLRGEKLSEAFVAGAIHRVATQLGQPGFAMLAPETPADNPPHYVLFLPGEAPLTSWHARLEAELRQNPHYDYCRQLGQLGALSVQAVGSNAGEIVLQREALAGKRLGEFKSNYLSKHSNWARVFAEHSNQRPIQPPSMFSTAPLR